MGSAGAEARPDRCIDWRRLRTDALEPLRRGRAARWQGIDFLAGKRADGSYAMEPHPTVREASPIVVLEGAYSTRPELLDLIDLAVLVDTSVEICHASLALREEASFLAAWHMRWDEPEAYYFRNVRPPGAFDRIVSGR